MKHTTKYDDIINLPHHVSSIHPQMPIADRAAQFSPFAALTGHDAAIKETARLTNRRVELDENSKSILNEKFQMIVENLQNQPAVTITYFLPDDKKEGGSYISVAGSVKKIDEYKRRIILADGTKIPIDEVFDIDGELFRNIDL